MQKERIGITTRREAWRSRGKRKKGDFGRGGRRLWEHSQEGMASLGETACERPKNGEEGGGTIIPGVRKDKSQSCPFSAVKGIEEK